VRVGDLDFEQAFAVGAVLDRADAIALVREVR
jgi:hypothetical protein